jgi:pimeloyl-ACP methyl ester carboxylesterase
VTYSAASPVFARSISAATFAAFLRRMASPAALEASAIHDAFATAGVDPAVALGQFAAESSFGKAGYAAITRNWGNITIRYPLIPHWTRNFGGKSWKAPNGRTYARFSTWRDGARAYAALLVSYRKGGHADNIGEMTDRWLGGHGAGYIRNICRTANAALGTPPPVVVPPPPVVPPPVIVPPTPVIPPISTTPEHVAFRPWQPAVGAFWTVKDDDWARVASVPTPSATFILVHGGPAEADSLEGMDNLAGRLADGGARAIAVRYPTKLGTSWQDAIAPLAAALGANLGATVVAHSLGGYFASLLAYAHPLARLVLIAADDQIGPEYRAALGNGPDSRALMRTSQVPVTVIAGSADLITTVAEAQNLVDALHATGHPGRFLVIDGADHDSILGDATVIAAILHGG